MGLYATTALGSSHDGTHEPVNELLPSQRPEVMRQLRRSLNLTLDAKVSEVLGRPASTSARHSAQIFELEFPVTINR